MKVTFMRTGERRYGVLVERTSGPAMAIHPAPGYDDVLPHDLLHFVAEAEWQIDGAVFGLLAAGGDPGSFGQVGGRSKLERRRQRPKGRRRGRRSELLADLLEQAWRARHGRSPLPGDWEQRLVAARTEASRVETVVDVLDGLAEQWRRVHVGESIVLDWPRSEGCGVRPARKQRRLPHRGRPRCA